MQAFFYSALDTTTLQPTLASALQSGYYLKSLAMYGGRSRPKWAAVFLPMPEGVVIDQVLEPEVALAFDRRPCRVACARTPFSGGYNRNLRPIWGLVHPLVFQLAPLIAPFTYDFPVMGVEVTRWQPGASRGRSRNRPNSLLAMASSLEYNLISIDAFRAYGDPYAWVCAIYQPTQSLALRVSTMFEEHLGGDWNADPRYDATRRGWARPAGVVPLFQPKASIASYLEFDTPDLLVTHWAGEHSGSVARRYRSGRIHWRHLLAGANVPQRRRAASFAVQGEGYWPIHVGANGPAGRPDFLSHIRANRSLQSAQAKARGRRCDRCFPRPADRSTL